jgi:hypothetical protein
MSEPVVTISGQRVYPRGQGPKPEELPENLTPRDAEGHPVVVTEMSPSGFASGGNEETLEAGLPFLGALVAVILVIVAALLIVRRSR